MTPRLKKKRRRIKEEVQFRMNDAKGIFHCLAERRTVVSLYKKCFMRFYPVQLKYQVQQFQIVNYTWTEKPLI
jgi:hypothetical protein